MKDSFVIFGICVLSIAFGSWLYFGPTSIPAGTQEAAVGTGNAVSFTELSDGEVAAGVTHPVNYTVENKDDLATVWALAYGASSTPPSIDFTQKTVYAIFDGEHPTGGYGVFVSDITDSVGARTVTITHTRPDSACVATDMVTSPFQIVSVPRTSRVLAHIDLTTTLPCP